MKARAIDPDRLRDYFIALGADELRNGKVVFEDPRPECPGSSRGKTSKKLEFDFFRMTGFCYRCSTKFSVPEMLMMFDPKFKGDFRSAFYFAQSGLSYQSLPDDAFINVSYELSEDDEEFGNLGTVMRRGRERKIVTELPEGFMPLGDEGESIQERLAIDYLLRRGIRLSRVKEMGVGVCPFPPWVGRLVMPVRDADGDIVLLTSRSYTEAFGHASKAHIDGDKTSLYGIHLAKNYSVGVLVEGMTDVLMNQPFFVASLGISLGSEQLNQLASWNPKKLFLMYDPEARQQSLGVALQIKDRKDIRSELFLAQLPDGIDPGTRGASKVVLDSLLTALYLPDRESVLLESLRA